MPWDNFDNEDGQFLIMMAKLVCATVLAVLSIFVSTANNPVVWAVLGALLVSIRGEKHDRK